MTPHCELYQDLLVLWVKEPAMKTIFVIGVMAIFLSAVVLYDWYKTRKNCKR